ncbi:MAG TPA: tetratricopeptide repeat protein, partial [Longimicrobiaceae bacterium]|nr:tetratricopeptide repeat protein [Longimicrobiaceae bacterium]
MRRHRALLAAGALVAAGTALAVQAAGPGGVSPGDAGAEVAALSRSIDFFERRLAGDPENFLAAGHLAERYVLRYRLAADEADVRRAEAVARRAVDVSPDPAGALARLSSIHLAQHEFAEALTAAERAVGEDPSDAPALGALFDAAMASGRYERAEWALR